jgi:hypothetical protein
VKKMTLQEHMALGVELAVIRSGLFDVIEVINGRVPVKAAATLETVIHRFDSFLSQLEEVMYRENERSKCSSFIYYLPEGETIEERISKRDQYLAEGRRI